MSEKSRQSILDMRVESLVEIHRRDQGRTINDLFNQYPDLASSIIKAAIDFYESPTNTNLCKMEAAGIFFDGFLQSNCRAIAVQELQKEGDK